MLDDESVKARSARQLFKQAYRHQRRGALADAIQLYKQSLAQYPTPEAHTYLGWTYGMLKRYDVALEECQRAIALDPAYGNPYNDTAAYLIELDRWAEAIPWLEQAIAAQRYENREFAHFNLGRVYDHLGRWDKARQCFRAAHELNPSYQLAHRSYLLVLAKLN